MNSSAVRKQQDNRKRNVTPSDVYKQEKAYGYRLSNPDNVGEEYITNVNILNLLSNNIPLISFSIERIAEVDGLWGDTSSINSIKGFKQRNSSTLTIPDFDKEELRIDESILWTKKPLEDQVQDDGIVSETPDNQWWVTFGRVERGKNGQVIFWLETMNSYDWQTQDDSTGMTINKIIELSLVNRRGESVKEFKIEFDAEALIGLPGGIKFLDDNNIPVDWDIDWNKTDINQFDITHISTGVVKNRDVLIESHAISCFKFNEWLRKQAKDSIGIPYNTINYLTLPWYTTGLNGPGGDNTFIKPLDIAAVNLSALDPKKQIETEFLENVEYFRFIVNYIFDDAYSIFTRETRDLSDDVKNNTIKNLLPSGVISEVTAAISKTYNYAIEGGVGHKDIILPNYDNENLDLNGWWTADWKENRNGAVGLYGYKDWYKDGLMIVLFSMIQERKKVDSSYAKNTINNLLTGKTNVYKGMVINELPATLTNMTRPDKYADFTEADRDHYVLSTFDIKKHYDENKDYYETLSPTRTNSLKKYASSRISERFDFLDPQSIRGMYLPFLFKQESNKNKRVIYGKFKQPIKFPKTYDLGFIDGGKTYSITQYSDEQLTPAVDKDGKEVSPIIKRTSWYRSKDKRFTRNSGSFAESSIKGMFTGKVVTNDFESIDKNLKEK